MKLVVVESPAKAKTINKYLGHDYHVVASVGHIRDLPDKQGSVIPEEDFAMHWDIPARSKDPIHTIRSELKKADKLILATDPDREGEAISWHIYHVMQDMLGDKPVERVVFNEITKSAVLDAMAHPREINNELVDAYMARRALDYLVGFTLSPVLWHKLPGAKSAGRVQSVALKLICEREHEIEQFISEEYWSIEARMCKESGDSMTARLTHLDGKKLGKMTINSKQMADDAVAAITASDFAVLNVETKRTQRNPNPPFTTSTLQQEASRKFGFSASRTMQIAQKLYEGINIGSETTGLITYMRTDGVQLSNDAIQSIRSEISNTKGDRYLPSTPRIYKSKAANAQEAHEAVRPTSINRHPSAMQQYLDKDQIRLYELIWKRTLASQMASAELDKTVVDIADRGGKATMRANGSIIVFDGFLSIYREDRDDQQNDGGDDDANAILPPVASGEPMTADHIKPEQHFTQPPPRYTDASLIKKMEELGIGRPSTYASILQKLLIRNYIEKDQRRFIPEERGRIVSAFLEGFFSRYVEYGFTARLEDDLDRISDGKLEWKTLLRQFWTDFKSTIDETQELPRQTILERIDPILENVFFPKDDNGNPIRVCSNCENGRLGLKVGRFGAFIGCSNYPECRYTRPVGQESDEQQEALADGDRHLGNDPETGLPVLVRKGPYGAYIQLGDADTKKPKRGTIPKKMEIPSLTLENGLGLLNLPREIGVHPESGEMISAGIGRYGPFIRFGSTYISIPDDDSVLTIGLNFAIDAIAKSGKTAGRNIGEHPDGGSIMLKSGRFGPYVEHDKIRATIPKAFDPDQLTLDEAIDLIAKKKAKGPGKAPPRGKAKASTKSKKSGTRNAKKT